MKLDYWKHTRSSVNGYKLMNMHTMELEQYGEMPLSAIPCVVVMGQYYPVHHNDKFFLWAASSSGIKIEIKIYSFSILSFFRVFCHLHLISLFECFLSSSFFRFEGKRHGTHSSCSFQKVSMKWGGASFKKKARTGTFENIYF